MSKATAATYRWLKRLLGGFGLFLLVYALFLLVGLIPVNNGFRPSPDGRVIYVVSSSIHADFIVPIETDSWDWRQWFAERDFPAPTVGASHMAIGWGDRGFYLDTPTWDDLKASTAVNAMLLPSSSVMHVGCVKLPPRDQVPDHLVACQVLISDEQYQRLCESIVETLETDSDGVARRIAGESFNGADAFYEAHGSYHCFYTCNSWVGRRLVDAGVRAPLFTPLPKSPLMYLEPLPPAEGTEEAAE